MRKGDCKSKTDDCQLTILNQQRVYEYTWSPYKKSMKSKRLKKKKKIKQL